MNDIGKRARELIAELSTNGFNDFDMPVPSVSCPDQWGEHYACIGNLYVDYYDAAQEAGDYFDGAALDYDFEIMLKDWFTFPDEKTQQVRSYETSKRDAEFDSSDGLVIVRYQKNCEELEVYRLVDGKIPGGDRA